MRAPARVRGFSLVTAIFVIVVVAVTVTVMIEVGKVSLTEQNMAIQGAQAYERASAGLQWAIGRAIAEGAGGTCSTVNTAVTVDGHPVSVTRTCTAHWDPTERHVYTISALASDGAFGTADYIQRQVVAVVAVPPAN